MDLRADGVRSITLAELKALGRFVRLQDLDESLADLAQSGEMVLSYPLFANRSAADKYVDVFLEPFWRRVELEGVAGEILYYRHEGQEGKLSLDPYRVAPAGYFTDSVDDIAGSEAAELLDNYKPPNPQEEIRSARLIGINGPYLNFEIRTYLPKSWVDESDIHSQTVSVHALDSRVRIPGVRSRPPLYNRILAVSHRWLSRSDPDSHGLQFRELMQTCEEHGIHETQSLAIDFCALPQRPRSAADQVEFTKALPEFQRLFSRDVIVLGEGAEDYGTRAWCMLELMQASLWNSIVNPEVLDGGLAAAYKLAGSFADSATWNLQELQAAVDQGGPDPLGTWMSDPINMGLYNQARSQQRRVLEMFEDELELAEEDDRPLVVKLVKDHFHLMKNRGSSSARTKKPEPLRKA